MANICYAQSAQDCAQYAKELTGKIGICKHPILPAFPGIVAAFSPIQNYQNCVLSPSE
jgi:hypothetical protein